MNALVSGGNRGYNPPHTHLRPLHFHFRRLLSIHLAHTHRTLQRIGLEVVKIILAQSPKNRVFLGCRNLKDGQRACSELDVGDRVMPVQLDICNGVSIQEAVATITSTTTLNLLGT